MHHWKWVVLSIRKWNCALRSEIIISEFFVFSWNDLIFLELIKLIGCFFMVRQRFKPERGGKFGRRVIPGRTPLQLQQSHPVLLGRGGRERHRGLGRTETQAEENLQVYFPWLHHDQGTLLGHWRTRESCSFRRVSNLTNILLC